MKRLKVPGGGWRGVAGRIRAVWGNVWGFGPTPLGPPPLAGSAGVYPSCLLGTLDVGCGAENFVIFYAVRGVLFSRF